MKASVPAPASARLVRCPGCGAMAAYAASNPSRPFCSERCRGADLGAWATEGYRVAAEPAEERLPDPPT